MHIIHCQQSTFWNAHVVYIVNGIEQFIALNFTVFVHVEAHAVNGNDIDLN